MQNLCLDKGYDSAQEEQESFKGEYVLHILIKEKEEKEAERAEGEVGEDEVKVVALCKKYSLKRWVVERTNSWHN